MKQLRIRQIRQQISQSELILLDKKANLNQQYQQIRKKVVSTRSFVTAFGVGFVAGLALLPSRRKRMQKANLASATTTRQGNFSQRLIHFASTLSTLLSIKQIISSILSHHPKPKNTLH